MEYPKTIEAIFLKRPNRFIAHVLINGVEEVVHVKNTGRCKELLVDGARVILEDCSHRPGRKTRYSLIAVWKGNILVNMDSQVPNKVVYDAINSNSIRTFNNIKKLKREVTYGNSRFDLYFEDENHKGFIEVKGVTLETNNIAMFPDAPTERGSKHILEMIEATKEGYKGIIFFLVQMEGPKLFRPNWEMDKKFSKSLKLAQENGVEILVYDSIVSPSTIELGQEVTLDL